MQLLRRRPATFAAAAALLSGAVVASPYLTDAAHAAQVRRLWDARPAGGRSVVYTVAASDGSLRFDTVAVSSAAQLSAVMDRHRSVEWDVTVHALGDTYRDLQWGIDDLGAPVVWPATKGAGTVVAVVDTGVNQHPDLVANLLPGYDFVDGDTDASDTSTSGATDSHGTHVAGIIAAVMDNTIGGAGAAPEAKILPVRALGGDGGTFSNIASGIVWAVDHGANVVNLSLGGSSASQTLQNAVTYAEQHGVVVVAAAGNDGPTGDPSYPAVYPTTLAVAAADSTDTVASFSTRGSYVDVAAPGVNIASTDGLSSYSYRSGTSMATPFVSAAAALLHAAFPSCTPEQLRTALMATAEDIGDTGLDTASGYGLARVDLAYQALLTGTVPALAATSTTSTTSTTTTVPTTTTTTLPPVLPAPGAPTAEISGVDVVVRFTAPAERVPVGYRVTVNGGDPAAAAAAGWTDKGAALLAGDRTYAVTAVYGDGLSVPATVTFSVVPPARPKISKATVSGRTVTLRLSKPPPGARLLVYRGADVVADRPAVAAVTLKKQKSGKSAYRVRWVTLTGASELSPPKTVRAR